MSSNESEEAEKEEFAASLLFVIFLAVFSVFLVFLSMFSVLLAFLFFLVFSNFIIRIFIESDFMGWFSLWMSKHIIHQPFWRFWLEGICLKILFIFGLLVFNFKSIFEFSHFVLIWEIKFIIKIILKFEINFK